MPTILPFRPGGTIKYPSHKQEHYRIKDDALRANECGPRAGDICRVSLGDIVSGQPHIVKTEDGQLLCGILTFDGDYVVLRFRNPDYPRVRKHKNLVSIIGRVMEFLCATSAEHLWGLQLPAVEGPISVPRFIPYEAPVHLSEGVKPEAIIAWRANASGYIKYASSVSRSLLEPYPRTWHYIRTVHPTQRRVVAQAWLYALTTQTPFDMWCKAHIKGRYQAVRNLAVPVLAAESGAVEWVGTLQVFGPDFAAASGL